MNNYRYFINVLEKDKPYNHKELYAELLRQKPDMSKNSIQWIIHDLCKTGDIVHDMYNHYRLPKAEEKRVYIPDYSVISRNVTKVIQKKYPTVDFTIFESIQLNEFLNHLVAQNTIFIQCEKEMSDFVFRYLQDEKYPNLMYLPSVDNFHYYWANNCLVVTNLIQEAPLNRQNPHGSLCRRKSSGRPVPDQWGQPLRRRRIWRNGRFWQYRRCSRNQSIWYRRCVGAICPGRWRWRSIFLCIGSF